MQYLFEMQIQEDIYPSEHLVFKSANYICVITSEQLYNDMLELSENRDKQNGRYSFRSIRNQRKVEE